MCGRRCARAPQIGAAVTGVSRIATYEYTSGVTEVSHAGTARGRPLSALLSQGLGKDVKMKADTACLTLLQLRDPEHAKAGGTGHGGKRLLVANAHLHWDPRRPDIKAVQVPRQSRHSASKALHQTP